MQENNDSNAGAAASGTGDSSASGSPQVTPGASSGASDNQNGTQTDPRDEQIRRQGEDIKSLNKALVEAKRGKGKGDQGDQEQDPFETPEGRYGVAIQLATSKL